MQTAVITNYVSLTEPEALLRIIAGVRSQESGVNPFCSKSFIIN
ncbi:hypothetical protein [Trichormus sp. NMC-1]|nr:hypothetical protein [Trichormus sp. NMC-1]